MLILNRRCQEAIIIAEVFTLLVTEITDSGCSIQLTGPAESLPQPLEFRMDRGESVRLGDDVEVKLTDVRGNTSVKLGFTADRSIPIDRQEIHRKKQTKTVENHWKSHNQTVG